MATYRGNQQVSREQRARRGSRFRRCCRARRL